MDCIPGPHLLSGSSLLSGAPRAAGPSQWGCWGRLRVVGASRLSEQKEPRIPALSFGTHLKRARVGVDLGLLRPGLIQDTRTQGSGLKIHWTIVSP